MREGTLRYLFQVNPNLSLLQGMRIHQRISIQSRLDPNTGFCPFQECFMERSDFAIRRFRSHWWNLWRIFLTYIHKSAQCNICAKSVICRQRRRCILCNSQEKNPDFPWNRAVGGSFLILKNFY